MRVTQILRGKRRQTKLKRRWPGHEIDRRFGVVVNCQTPRTLRLRLMSSKDEMKDFIASKALCLA